MARAEVRSPAVELAEALSTMAEMLSPLGEAVDGCREDALRRGYSPTAAEQMAIGYHQYLLTMLSQPATAASK